MPVIYISWIGRGVSLARRHCQVPERRRTLSFPKRLLQKSPAESQPTQSTASPRWRRQRQACEYCVVSPRRRTATGPCLETVSVIYVLNDIRGMGPKSNMQLNNLPIHFRSRCVSAYQLAQSNEANNDSAASASPLTTFMKITLSLLLAITALATGHLNAKKSESSTPLPADPGWPRQRTSEQGSLVYYQPQVDAWTNFKQLDFRMAFSLTPKGGKEIVGILELQAQTDVNVDDRSVVISNFKIKEVKLPGLDPAKASTVDQMVRSFLPPDHTVVMALDRLVASVEKTQTPAAVPVQNDPPVIFISNTPAILFNIDGEAVRADIAGTNLGFVVNSNFPLFFEKGGANYLFTGEQWLKSPVLEGPWAPVASLPKDMTKVANDPKWAQMKKPILSPSAKGKPPTIFYSTKPAEVILFQGQPNYANIPGTQLTVATNTDADLFVYTPTQAYYYLAAGRWFKASDLKGPWTYTTPDLPPDFANIPENSPAGRVLISVPGTDDAKDAVLMAQVPTTATVDPKAAEQAKVTYTGDPEFRPIEGTSMEYATNTADKVIKLGDVYY